MMNITTTIRTRTAAVAILIALAPISAFAQSSGEADVQASLTSREAYVGVPIALRVEISNAATHEVPLVPAIEGVRVESLGSPGRSSQTTIINGHRTHKESITYAWKLTPQKAGRFVVPELAVSVDGQTRRTNALPFVATKSETGDLLFAEVSGQQDSIYVGQPLTLKLQIWIKPYRDAQLGVTLSEGDMWSFVSEDPTAFGVFSDSVRELAESRQRPAGREVLRLDSDGNEHAYYLYEIETTVYPRRPGQVDAENAQVVVSYPTALGRSRDMFSMFERSLRVTGTRPVVADAVVQNIDVRAVPTAGRPPDYRGAVGHYEIVAQAVPTHVQAGDPITLHVGIHGDGPMDLLQAPPIWELDEFTRDFKVPQEPPAGTVRDGVKLFSISIRPRREGIAYVPAVPLTYFDPQTESFVTVDTEPIRIQVDKAESLELASIIGEASGPTADNNRKSGVSAENVVSYANATGPELLKSKTWLPLSWLVIALLAGPVLFAGMCVVHRLFWSATGWKTPRLSRADTVARKAILAAREPRDVAAALLGYIAELLNLPSRSLTRTEAISQLSHSGRVDGLDELDDILLRCEEATYSTTEAANIGCLAAEGLACLDALPAKASRSRRSNARQSRQPKHNRETVS